MEIKVSSYLLDGEPMVQIDFEHTTIINLPASQANRLFMDIEEECEAIFAEAYFQKNKDKT